MRVRIKGGRSLIFLTVFSVIYLFPIYWLFSCSLKTGGEFLRFPPTLVPSSPTLDNFVTMLFDPRFELWRYFGNTLFIAGTSTLLSLLCGTLGAYAFSRFKFPMSSLLFFITLIVRIIPGTAIILPLFLLFMSYNLLDTPIAIILAHMTFQFPFISWIMTSFFRELPRESEEAAWLDGSSKLGTLFRVVIPSAAPAMASTAIFSFMSSWNDYMYAVAFTSTLASKTLAVKVAETIYPYYILYGPMFAGAVITAIPCMAFAFLTQKYLTRGFRITTK